MTTPQFVDVSAWQSDIDWAAYKRWAEQFNGTSYVALRSSYGTLPDAAFARHYGNALAIGIDVILIYHYAYPNLNSAQNEADFQHALVGTMRAQDLLILDFEENVPQATSSWAYLWLARQEQNYGGKLPGIYSYDSFIRQRLQDSRLARFPLWLAIWVASQPACPPPWASYKYWQFTNYGSVPGISARVDMNVSFDTTTGETPMALLTLDNPDIKKYFTGTEDRWHCIQTGCDLIGDILNFYKANNGLTNYGLPLTNERYPYPGVAEVDLERARLRWDPHHVMDNPVGSVGTVYLAHIDPLYDLPNRVESLNEQNDALQKKNEELTKELEEAKTNPPDIAALQAQLQEKQTALDEAERKLKLATDGWHTVEEISQQLEVGGVI